TLHKVDDHILAADGAEVGDAGRRRRGDLLVEAREDWDVWASAAPEMGNERGPVIDREREEAAVELELVVAVAQAQRFGAGKDGDDCVKRLVGTLLIGGSQILR